MSGADRNLTWHEGMVLPIERALLLGQSGCVVWLTGLSGAGKSTLARALERRLTTHRHLVYVLDGDNVRHGLCADLGFSAEARQENIRRLGEVAALFADAGTIVVVAVIAPYRADRDRARAAAPSGRFFEVFVDAPIEVCEGRDPKGLYRRARAGEIRNFTGISAPYEIPTAPDVVVRTGACDVSEGVDAIAGCLEAAGVLRAPSVTWKQSAAG